MRDTKNNGAWIFTTATLLDQPKTTVSYIKLNVRLSLFVLAEKKGLDLQVVHIYFDTSTFDQVEKDVKVVKK